MARGDLLPTRRFILDRPGLPEEPQAGPVRRSRRRRRSRRGGRRRIDPNSAEIATEPAPGAEGAGALPHDERAPFAERDDEPRADDARVADAERTHGRRRSRRRRRRGGVPDQQRQQMLDLLRREFGLRHFRPGQEQIIRAVLDGRDTLAVLPTGGGKSLTYQLPSLVLDGLTVVVSPLIALIRDQFEKLRARGVETVRLDSSLTGTEREAALTLLEEGKQKVVLITPEGATAETFRKRVGQKPISLLVIDEAHCVSEWGHDFRPSYLALGALAEELGRPTVLALTATAPPQVREEIVKRLALRDPVVVVRPVARPNLRFEVIRCESEDMKRRELVQLLRRLRRPGIVYCSTVKDVEELGALCKLGRIPAEIYHGRLTKAERDHAHLRFMSSGKRIVMIATSAFGLGVDKPDIRYVVHYNVPGSLEAYVQEAGRAGRDGLAARCILLYLPEDLEVQRHFLTEGPASRSQIKKVVDGLAAWTQHGQPVEPAVLAMSTEVGITRTKAVLEGLRDAGMVEEVDGGFRMVGNPQQDAVKLLNRGYEERRTQDRRRLDGMIQYATQTDECRVSVIRRYFEDGELGSCQRCDVCEPKLRRRRRRTRGRGDAGGDRYDGPDEG
jgi:ATP-dependent DNA helicase RecQ